MKIHVTIYTILLLLLGWVIWLLVIEVNGPTKLREYEKQQLNVLVDRIATLVELFRKENDGKLPSSPSQLLRMHSALKNELLISSFIPSSCRNRLGIEGVVFEETPELADVFSLWTIEGSEVGNDYTIILNPGFFGKKTIIVAHMTNNEKIINVVSAEYLRNLFKNSGSQP